MKLARYAGEGGARVALADGDRLIDLGPSTDCPNEMPDLAANPAAVRARQGASLPLDPARLLAPIGGVRKFLAIGMNYGAHRREIVENSSSPELGQDRPVQVWFNKQTSCINPPYAPIVMPRISAMLDYEGELAFVIGRGGRHIAAADALDHIAGYMVCNDVSVRDWQRASPTMTMGKSFDTHGPLGPWLVTPDAVGDPQQLEIVTTLNGEVRQRFSTAEMIATCADMIAHLSAAFTLQPGDVIATGTGAGVGALSTPPRLLTVGDRIRVEISKIGAIEADVIAEA